MGAAQRRIGAPARSRAGRRPRQRNWWVYLLLLIALVFFLFPVYWMLVTAVKPPSEWLTTPPILWPSSFHWTNFTDALGQYNGAKGLKDSTIVATLSTILSMLVGILAGYSLGRYRTGGSNLSFFILSILFMPPVAVGIPMFLFWSNLGQVDTYQVLIIQYAVFNVPFVTWIMKGFFEDMAPELEESALVNGATRLQALYQVVLPLAVPAMVATALLTFIFSWNEFFFAVILTRGNVTTLPFILPTLMESHDILWGDIAAIATLGALPPIIVAFALQRYLVRGLSFGAVRQA